MLAAAGLVAGCSTTMQEAARLQLNSARIRASEVSTRVTVAGRAVTVTRVALISGGGSTAFVISVRNRSSSQVSDLPISVGVRVGRERPVYYNAAPGAEYSYFEAHLPVLRAGATLTWVYSTHRRTPSDARPFAIVGGRPSPAVAPATPLPVIRVRVSDDATPARAVIALHNLSAVPQYQLPVFAFAERGGRYVAAGDVTVEHLGGQATTTLALGLVGSLVDARLQIEAPAAVLQ